MKIRTTNRVIDIDMYKIFSSIDVSSNYGKFIHIIK